MLTFIVCNYYRLYAAILPKVKVWHHQFGITRAVAEIAAAMLNCKYIKLLS